MKTSDEGRTTSAITLNHDQKLYVIPCGQGFSCFGFDNARGHARHIADRLGRPELAFAAGEYGTLDGYATYQRAVQAWAASPLSRQTYFDPGTPADASRVLEACRKSGDKVRLILGDTTTGESWLDEHDVVGTIGRSGGMLKVPLLIADGECGGAAILTAHLLAVVRWSDGRWLYRHAAYRAPELSLMPTGDTVRPWAVWRSAAEVARFGDLGKAGAYVAFMHGETVEPRVFT
jgi:hypothetical protein